MPLALATYDTHDYFPAGKPRKFPRMGENARATAAIAGIPGNPLGMRTPRQVASSPPKPSRTRVRYGSASVPHSGTIAASQPDGSHRGLPLRTILGDFRGSRPARDEDNHVEHYAQNRLRIRHAGPLAAVALGATLLFAHSGVETAAGDGPVEHIRGIYLQQAIEIATVGTRTVRLTRMTRFRRCGRLRGAAQDFNDHLVEVTGREVEGFGFVAGFVNAIEGCAAGVTDEPNGHDTDRHGMGP